MDNKLISTEKVELAQDDHDASHEELEPIVTKKTWVVVFALAMGYGLSFWPIPLMANVGADIAAELNAADKFVWFIPAWTSSVTVCFMICGANTDLLGRRWFLVIGNLIAFVGHITVATSKNANAVIAGMAITGFGGGNAQMAAFALAELLPNKWRHIGVVIADWGTFTAQTVSPASGRFGVHDGTWRWNFYVAGIMQFCSFLALLFLYFPPKHPHGIPFKQAFRELDYVGMVLFTAGALPILMGIVWTNDYASDSAHVVAPFAVGFPILVAFCLWERYAPLKHPLTPTYVFSASHGRDLTAPCIALAVVNMAYYASSLLWPTMINEFYTNFNTDWRYGVLLSAVQGMTVGIGAIGLTTLGSKIQHWQWQLTVATMVMVLFGTLFSVLGKPDNKGMTIALFGLSQVGYGWAIYLSMAICQMGVNHEDLGISGGIAGTARFAGGSIATAVYTTILTNTVSKWTVRLVSGAATKAGLPASEVPGLMKAIGTVGQPSFEKTYGAPVTVAVGRAIQAAYEHGIRNVAYASLAFGIVGLIACLCCKDVAAKMNNKIEVYLENTELADRNTYH